MLEAQLITAAGDGRASALAQFLLGQLAQGWPRDAD
jgi:hypothetical protein